MNASQINSTPATLYNRSISGSFTHSLCSAQRWKFTGITVASERKPPQGSRMAPSDTDMDMDTQETEHMASTGAVKLWLFAYTQR